MTSSFRIPSWLGVFGVFLRLGLTSFGGPVAHLGYFRRAFVERRRWLDEADYAELVALAQLLPGPASSQVGFALGWRRAGPAGALAAFAGFTLPSALAMILFAAAAGALTASPFGEGAMHGLKLAAVAVVAQAVVAMARSLSRGWVRGLTTAAAAGLSLALGGLGGQLAAIGLGAVVGAGLLAAPPLPGSDADNRVSRRVGAACLVAFAVLLALCPFMNLVGGAPDMFAAFYRCGALVFGGGHVVAPLLIEATTSPGWVPKETFLQGYGAAQALPGPLFAFAAFLGAAGTGPVRGLSGALLATLAIFLPGLLLMTGALPYWRALSAAPRARSALAGVNAAVVGILAAALYSPIGADAVRSPSDMGIAVAAFILLVAAKAPPLVVVIACIAAMTLRLL